MFVELLLAFNCTDRKELIKVMLEVAFEENVIVQIMNFHLEFARNVKVKGCKFSMKAFNIFVI